MLGEGASHITRLTGYLPEWSLRHICLKGVHEIPASGNFTAFCLKGIYRISASLAAPRGIHRALELDAKQKKNPFLAPFSSLGCEPWRTLACDQAIDDHDRKAKQWAAPHIDRHRPLYGSVKTGGPPQPHQIQPPTTNGQFAPHLQERQGRQEWAFISPNGVGRAKKKKREFESGQARKNAPNPFSAQTFFLQLSL